MRQIYLEQLKTEKFSQPSSFPINVIRCKSDALKAVINRDEYGESII